jgi:hypothetical protein
MVRTARRDKRLACCRRKRGQSLRHSLGLDLRTAGPVRNRNGRFSGRSKRAFALRLLGKRLLSSAKDWAPRLMQQVETIL